MNDAVFSSVSQALHVSFLIASMPPIQRSQMQAWIEAMMRESRIWDESPPPRSLDFRGLDPLELRAQCALVEAAVRDHLHGLERASVFLIYSLDNNVKLTAMESILERTRCLLSVQDVICQKALVWSLFGTFDMGSDLSVERISRDRGAAARTLHRDKKAIKNTVLGLRQRAIDSLEPLFLRTKLVGEIL